LLENLQLAVGEEAAFARHACRMKYLLILMRKYRLPDSLEQSSELGTKDSKRHVPSDLQPISQQSLEGTSTTDDTDKIETTTESGIFEI